ncbi:MAG: PQQ-dependent dehydrogenase, methanol/ethanol family [Parahaliea sp.]
MKPFAKTLSLCVLALLTAPALATTVDNALLANEADGSNWASYGRTFSENHFSPLKRVNDQNVGSLKLAWYYDIEPVSSVVAAPLAVDGVLYFATGYSVIHAMDARSGKLLWRFDPKAPEAAGHKLRGGWGIRGIAFWQGKVYTGTHDGRLIAIDAKTGKQVWSVQTLPTDDASYITGAPWVFNGKVAIGFGGADFGVTRGYVTAYDAETGEQAWRFYVVPGNPADGFENEAMKMAAATWSGEWWKFGGGGTVWAAMAYDPKYNRLLLGTGNGMPVNHKIRSEGKGDNLFLGSIVAVDADTGEYVWHYQVNPGETWDYNANMDIELAELEIDGKRRSVLMTAPKNGFFYVIDREDGKLLSAEPFAKVTWASQIDLQTGKPVEDASARFPSREEGALIFPSTIGAHSIQAMSYSPATGLVYIPKIERGGAFADPPGDLSQWQPAPNMAVNQGLGLPAKSLAVPPTSSLLQAWDPVARKEVWSAPQPGTSIFNGGVASTAGNLVFQGKVDGEFVAYAADTGKPLWRFDAQTGIQGQPITYLADGKQYVTIMVGWRGMGNSGGIEPEWEYRLQPRRVLTFALDGKAELPPAGPRTLPFLDDPDFKVDADKAALGRTMTFTHCGLCHGFGLNTGGAAPDLRRSPIPLSIDGLTGVLRDGLLVPRGMPQFGEFTDEQIEGIQHYIRQQARRAAGAGKGP